MTKKLITQLLTPTIHKVGVRRSSRLRRERGKKFPSISVSASGGVRHDACTITMSILFVEELDHKLQYGSVGVYALQVEPAAGITGTSAGKDATSSPTIDHQLAFEDDE
jgi:hypothetical protein